MANCQSKGHLTKCPTGCLREIIRKAKIRYRVMGYYILEATLAMANNCHGDHTGWLYIDRQLPLPSMFEWTKSTFRFAWCLS